MLRKISRSEIGPISFLPSGLTSASLYYSNRQNEIHLTLDMWTLVAFVPENNILAALVALYLHIRDGLTE